MDERELEGDRIDIDHNTYVTYVTTRVRTGEEHQVATLDLVTTDGSVAGILVARRGANEDACLLLINVTCKTRTVESTRTLGA